MSQQATRNAPLAILLWAGMVGAMLLTGVLLGAAPWFIGIGFFLAVLAALVFSLGLRGFEDHKGRLIAVGWCGMLLVPGLNQLLRVPVGYVFELFIFGLIAASIRGWYKLATRDKVTRILIALLLLHFVAALLSSLFGRSHSTAGLWQFQYNLKWPLMFGLGALVVWTDRTDKVIRNILGLSWLFIVPVLALEVVAPALHERIFGIYADIANPYFDEGTRYRGPFAAAGSFGLIMALLAAGSTVQFLTGRGFRWLGIALIYVSLLVVSGQRQEMAGLLLALLLIAAIRWRKSLPLLATGVGVLGCLLTGALLIAQHIPMERALAQWGAFEDATPLSARATLTYKGLEVAERYFPLGSGLGTYGGPGAQKFDQSLFLDLGFGHLWWFQRGKYLVDTYWPCVIAESGFIGAALLLSFFLVLWGALLVRTWRASGTPAFPRALLGLAAITLLLFNTPTSPTLMDPRGAFLFWMLVAAAWRVSIPAASPSPRRKAVGLVKPPVHAMELPRLRH